LTVTRWTQVQQHSHNHTVDIFMNFVEKYMKKHVNKLIQILCMKTSVGQE